MRNLAITEGAQASFTVSTWPGETFEGKIEHVSHVIDARTRSMAVELAVDNANARLTPGAYAVVSWPVHRARPSLFVPATECTFVDRVRDGTLDQVVVQRGAAGDRVLRRGSETLKLGATIATRVWTPPDAGAGH